MMHHLFYPIVSVPSEFPVEAAPAEFEGMFFTNRGVFSVYVKRAVQPRAADRFYTLLKAGFFNGNKFFKVIPGFIAQFGINGL